jgi:hypothetical protein
VEKIDLPDDQVIPPSAWQNPSKIHGDHSPTYQSVQLANFGKQTKDCTQSGNKHLLKVVIILGSFETSTTQPNNFF